MLDELVADPDVASEEVAKQARAATERLFGKAGSGGTTETRLVELIQQEPTVAMAFQAVNAQLNHVGATLLASR